MLLLLADGRRPSGKLRCSSNSGECCGLTCLVEESEVALHSIAAAIAIRWMNLNAMRNGRELIARAMVTVGR